MKQIKINISDKVFYTFVAMIAILLLVVSVYAYNKVFDTTPNYNTKEQARILGHSADELNVKIGGVVKTLQQAIDDGDFTSQQKLADVVWFGNLGRLLGDGAGAGRISCSYTTGSFCNVCASAQVKKENGKIYTRAWTGESAGGCTDTCGSQRACDSGWVEGYVAECAKTTGTIYSYAKSTATYNGVNLKGGQESAPNKNCQISGEWK